MKKTLLLTAMIAMVVTLGLQLSPAAAAPDSIQRISLLFTYERLRSQGGVEWLDDDGILHIRHRIDTGVIEGRISGRAILDFNCDIDTHTGDGVESGQIWIYENSIDPLGSQSGWVGEWTHQLRDWIDIDGELLAEGFGLNDGKLMVVTRVYRNPRLYLPIENHIGYILEIP